MSEVDPEGEDQFTEQTERNMVNNDDLGDQQDKINILENQSHDSKVLFENAKNCNPNTCDTYAMKINRLFLKKGEEIKIPATKQDVLDGITRANARIEEVKNNARETARKIELKKNQSLKDTTDTGIKAGIIGVEDTDSNGNLDLKHRETHDAEGNPVSKAGETLTRDSQTIVDDLKESRKGKESEEVWYKRWYKKIKNSMKDYVKRKITGSDEETEDEAKKRKWALGVNASLLAFVISDISISFAIGRSRWSKHNGVQKDSITYSGCYAQDKKTGEIYKLGACGYPPTKLIGLGCSRCCPKDKKECPKACNEGLESTACKPQDTDPCPCNRDTGQCTYPKDLVSIGQVIQSGAVNFCRYSTDEYSTTHIPCSSTLIACNPTHTSDGKVIPGAQCTDEILKASKNLAGNPLDINNLDNYTFTSVCFTANDIFLMNNYIANSIRYQNTLSTKGKVFSIIMIVLAVILFIVTMIWYGFKFYNKYKSHKVSTTNYQVT